MKEMYRREKRRIRFERWSWITITWILYLIKLQGQVPSFYSQHYEERANMILDFDASILIFLGFFLLLSVNDTLFFIREQGKKVYLLEKYAIVPMRKKKLYEVRVRLFLETILYFIIGASCIYAIMTIANTSFEKNRGTESFGILKIFMAGNLNFLSYNTIKSNEVTKG